MGHTSEYFIAGWVGGICGLLVGHPLDTIKVRQQTYGVNFISAARKTFKYEGILGFYKGMLFPSCTVGNSNAICFGTYSIFLSFLQNREKRSYNIAWNDWPAVRRVFLAGCVASIFESLYNCPFDFIKTSMQVKTEGSWSQHYQVPYKNSFGALTGIIRDRGITGLYRGLTPMLLRDVPTGGVYFLTYELLLHYYFSKCTTRISIKELMAGGIAGATCWFVATPMDVVKSRMQTDNPDNPQYRGIIDCAKKMFQEGGFRMFYKGCPAIIFRAFVAHATVFTTFETMLMIMHQE